MSDLCLRSMQVAELRDYYPYIRRDFPVGEYPPYEILRRHLENGHQQGFILHDQHRDLGYAICAPSNNYVLISLLAVLSQWRYQGYGSRLLSHLFCFFGQRQGLIVEVERPDKTDDAEQIQSRQARIDFYRRAGFSLLADIDYTIWDVPMYLMACPLQNNLEEIYQNIDSIINEIYLRLMGERYMHKLSLTRLYPDLDGKASSAAPNIEEESS